MSYSKLGNMGVIYCEKCRLEPDGSDCRICGGTRMVLCTRHCPKCGKESWVTPGSRTSYEGKRWFSVDGVEWIDHKDGANCYECEAKP